MSRQALGAYWIRRIERVIGERVYWASGNGTYWHEFTTMNHRHGRINARSLEVQFYEATWHFTSCDYFKRNEMK